MEGSGRDVMEGATDEEDKREQCVTVWRQERHRHFSTLAPSGERRGSI